jgi:hypothetical protein
MRIRLSDLKKALAEIEAKSKDEMVNIKIDSQLYLMFEDRYNGYVEIRLFENGTMLPKIRKEDILS